MRKSMTVTCITATAVAIYLGWVFYVRWKSNQELIQRLKAPIEERNQAMAKAYSGGMKIAAFYAVPPSIRRGETARLCYSVISAENIHIEPPPAEDVWPSRSRCVTVAPQTDTTYKIIAKDSEGNTKTAALTIMVR